MKLCDIGADRYDEVMAAVPALIENLAKNKEFSAMMFRGDINANDLKTAKQIMQKRISEHLPKLMVNAKKELCAYFSLLDGVSEAEFAKKMTIGTMISGITEMLNDAAFINFFGLYQTPSME